MTNVKLAIDTIFAGRDKYTTAEAYYEGTIGEIVGSRRLAGHMRGLDYNLNFARTVVDSVNNRLDIAAAIGTSSKANSALNVIWEQNEMGLETNEIHRRALMFGDCYAIVWPDADGKVEITYASPMSSAIVYSEESPRIKSFGAKMWVEETTIGKRTRVNLYFADRIEKYTLDGTITNGGSADQFKLTETIDNPFGVVPMFHFRTQRPYGRPEHADAYGPQDMVNKLVIMHMTAVDYQGAPQRYALSSIGTDAELNDFEEGDTDRENVGSLRNGPGELWYLKGVQSVGEFKPADPGTFTDPMKDYVRAMASMTSTPLHYFERTGQVPSGEALRTAEAPLTKKVANRQESFGSTWRDLLRFALAIDGIKSDVQIKWAPVESIDSLDTWEVAVKKYTVGVPLNQILAELGYDKEVISAIEESVPSDLAKPGMNSTNIARQRAAEGEVK